MLLLCPCPPGSLPAFLRPCPSLHPAPLHPFLPLPYPLLLSSPCPFPAHLRCPLPPFCAPTLLPPPSPVVPSPLPLPSSPPPPLSPPLLGTPPQRPGLPSFSLSPAPLPLAGYFDTELHERVRRLEYDRLKQGTCVSIQAARDLGGSWLEGSVQARS